MSMSVQGMTTSNNIPDCPGYTISTAKHGAVVSQVVGGFSMKSSSAVRRIALGILVMEPLAGYSLATDSVNAGGAQPAEVPIERNVPAVQGHPITSVVITQCNLIVAVYMTMSDGRLLRFDKATGVPLEGLLQAAYSATRSERVEVSCGDSGGVVGYEKHDAT
jgi:hypothetical protein